MTTDLVPKMAAYAWHEDGVRYTIGGIAKGSGMIAPNMATMLAFLATDAAVSRASLQDALRDAADGSFNMISVDGDMSTNDAVYACAKPGPAEATPGLRAALAAVCRDLAVAMVEDGEGATKLLTFRVSGARDAAPGAHDRPRGDQLVAGQDRALRRPIPTGAASWPPPAPPAPAWIPSRGRSSWASSVWVERGAIEALSEAEAHHVLEDHAIEARLDLGHRRRRRDRLGLRPHRRLRAHQRPLPDVSAPARSRPRRSCGPFKGVVT